MKDLVIRTLRLPATLLLISSLTVLVSAPMMYGQAPVNAATADPGPRNPGNVNAGFCPTLPGTIKFTATSTTSNMGMLAPGGTECVDIIQPPSVSPQPPANGA